MRLYAVILPVMVLAIASCSKNPKSLTTTVERNDRPSSSLNGGTPGGLTAVPRGPGSMAPLPFGPLPSAVGAGEGGSRSGASGMPVVAIGNNPENDSRYRAALGRAMTALAERKFEDALNEFTAARNLRPADSLTMSAVDHVQQRAESETAAEQIAANIRSILDEGRSEEAAKLATSALQEFSNSQSIDALLKLKREADSLIAVSIENRAARLERFRGDYQAAAKAGNMRAALLALEQFLDNGGENTLAGTYQKLQRDLNRYDELRSRAYELNRDAARLEEAIALLQEAQKIWNTVGIRQGLELAQLELQLITQNARDRLAVADFEVRGEIGLPQAGAYVADQLLPAFKSQYDLVERGQFNKIVEELKLQSDLFAEDPAGQREVSKAAKARYLVVGSITPINGITVQARLVDVETGLVLQTARITAQTPEELTQRLPQLADELQMTDGEKQTAEQKRAKEAAPIEVLKPAEGLQLPPPPEPMREVPPPVIPPRPKPPEVNILPEQLDNLPPAPPPDQIIASPAIPATRDRELRRRMLFVALELGDNCFRRGLFRDALRHFELALNLFPDLHEVRLRVDRCRPLVAPVVGWPGHAAPIVRPRVAMLDFVVLGKPAVVPPYLGWWIPECMAPYFCPEYQMADRAELFWWMGRLGLTPYDLLNDPAARLYLGRAMNVRYFLFGNVIETGSFNVTNYLVDAEFGFLVSSARIHVRRLEELKPRLSELARLTKMTSAERRQFESETAQWDLLLNDIRQVRRQPERYQLCIELCNKALNLRPGNVEVMIILRDVTWRQQRERPDFNRGQDISLAAALKEEKDRQVALARETEMARLRSEAQALAEVERRKIARQREAAADRLIVQARAHVQAKQYGNAVAVFESAIALRPNQDAVIRELALARAKVEETQRANLAEARASREAAIRRQREQELAQARSQLEAERKRQKDLEQTRLREVEQRDRRESDRLLALAQQHSARQEYDQAVAAAQKAKQLRSTPEVDRLLSQLLIELARANAEKKGIAAKAELERQLAAEEKARLATAQDAAKNGRMYEQCLIKGRQLLNAGKLAEAEEQFLAARKIHQTDAVLTALKQLEAAKAQARAKLDTERRRAAELKRQNDELKQQLAEAQSALAKKQTERAVNLFREAKKIAPTNIDVLAGLTKAEQLRDQELAAERKQSEDQAKRDSFKRLLASGKANLAAKRYEAASLALGEALKLFPNDRDAKEALAEANAKAAAEGPADVNSQQRAAKYQGLMSDGRRFLAAKQYDKALQAFHDAQTLMKVDKAAEEFATETLRLKSISETLARFRKAISSGKLDEAAAAYQAAAAIDAKHPDVIKALAELRAAQDAAQAAKSAAAQAEQKKKDFAKFLSQARASFQAKRLDDAAKSIASAVALFPNDKDAQALRGQIDQARREAAASAQKRQQFNQYIQQGRAAMGGEKFADALKAFESARALFPNDPDALKGLADANKALDAPKPAGKPPLYARQMDQAAALERAGRYDQALAAYQAALRIVPNDADADKKSDFCQFMVEGDKAMKSRKFADARAAFENALKLFPDDFNAKSALQRAKMAK